MNLFDVVREAPRFDQIADARLVQPDHLTALSTWAREAPELFVDYETNGLSLRKGHRPFACGLYSPEKGAKYVDFRHTPNGEQAIKDGLAARKGKTVAFNLGFETRMSRALGFKLGGDYWDPMASAYALHENRKPYGDWGPLSQKALVKLECGLEPKFAAAVKAWLSMNTGQEKEDYHHVPPELMVPYCCEDVTQGWALHKHLEKQVIGAEMVDLVATDSALADVVARLEDRGIAFDEAYAKELIERFSVDLKAAYRRIKDALGYDFDVASDQKLFGLLYGDFRLPMHEDQEKFGKLDKDVLDWFLCLPQVLESPKKKAVIEGVLDWRECTKLLDTYLRPWCYEWQENGIIYPNLNICGPDTRRFSAERPNMQNVPTRTERGAFLRGCFVSRPGWETYSMDEKQAEYRFFAHYSNHPDLIGAFKKGRDVDFHEEVSQLLGVKRKVGKNLNFGLLYGMGVDKLARELSEPARDGKPARIVSKAEAQKLRDQYYTRFPAIVALRKSIELEIRNHGYVKTIFGGRRHLTAKEAFKGLNTKMQMSVADLLRKAMVLADRILTPAGGNILLQVHDDLPFELPGDARDHGPTLKRMQEEAMEAFPQLRVPMYCDAKRWNRRWNEGVELEAA